jgi:hypothetical protein
MLSGSFAELQDDRVTESGLPRDDNQARGDVPEDGFGGTGRRARRTGAYVKPAGGPDGPV